MVYWATYDSSGYRSVDNEKVWSFMSWLGVDHQDLVNYTQMSLATVPEGVKSNPTKADYVGGMSFLYHNSYNTVL